MAMSRSIAAWCPGATVALTFLLLCHSAAAQTINQFSAPAQSEPDSITAGPDGALWFTEDGTGQIGRITTAGATSSFPVPTALAFGTRAYGTGIAIGVDGALWFTEPGGNKIGRITTAGLVTEFVLPTPNSGPFGIAGALDLWFTEYFSNKIGRIDFSSGAITEFAVPSANSNPTGIAWGPDGALWFAEEGPPGKIGRITLDGAVTEFATPTTSSFPLGITRGPDGALWFTERGCGSSKGLSCNGAQTPGQIGRITTAGVITEFPLPNGNNDFPLAITAGPDGNLWYVNTNGGVGHVTTAGSSVELMITTAATSTPFPYGITKGPDGALWVTEPGSNQIGQVSGVATNDALAAAVLPASRSVMVGNTATAFATIINAGPDGASACGLAPATMIPASFTYQTTDPTTNAAIGTANTPVPIASGMAQTYVFALTPTAAFAPTEVALTFNCGNNVNAAPSLRGVNTLLLSSSATPVPDIVAVAGTATRDGILRIAGSSASNAFAVATVNLGASSSITASINTGGAILPLTLTLCHTDPVSGQCISPVGANVTTTIDADATLAFGIFGAASGFIPFDPANSRIFVQFTDTSGAVRGETSVAVAAQ
jgi:virginiamycin B lyase